MVENAKGGTSPTLRSASKGLESQANDHSKKGEIWPKRKMYNQAAQLTIAVNARRNKAIQSEEVIKPEPSLEEGISSHLQSKESD